MVDILPWSGGYVLQGVLKGSLATAVLCFCTLDGKNMPYKRVTSLMRRIAQWVEGAAILAQLGRRRSNNPL